MGTAYFNILWKINRTTKAHLLNDAKVELCSTITLAIITPKNAEVKYYFKQKQNNLLYQVLFLKI